MTDLRSRGVEMECVFLRMHKCINVLARTRERMSANEKVIKRRLISVPSMKKYSVLDMI